MLNIFQNNQDKLKKKCITFQKCITVITFIYQQIFLLAFNRQNMMIKIFVIWYNIWVDLIKHKIHVYIYQVKQCL